MDMQKIPSSEAIEAAKELRALAREMRAAGVEKRHITGVLLRAAGLLGHQPWEHITESHDDPPPIWLECLSESYRDGEWRRASEWLDALKSIAPREEPQGKGRRGTESALGKGFVKWEGIFPGLERTKGAHGVSLYRFVPMPTDVQAQDSAPSSPS